MEQIMQVLKMTDVVALGIIILSFTQVAKQLLPDDVEGGYVMLVALVIGIAFGFLGFKVGIIETAQSGILEGVISAGIVSGGISFVFEAIDKIKGTK